MRGWEFSVSIDGPSDLPLFQRIARAISDDVARGRLKPGDRLPGSRTLAKSVGVHRNTVLMALDELRAQGVVRMEAARGTLIAGGGVHPGVDVANVANHRGRAKQALRRRAPRAGFDLPPALLPWEGLVRGPPGTLALQSGVPDLRLLPVEELARAWRRAARRHGEKLLAYADPAGHPALRTAIATMLAATRGIAADASQVLVVRGSQMGLDLCARLLVRPGDVVAVDELGYPPAWAALLAAGARLLPIRVDGHGLDVDGLARAVATSSRSSVGRIRAVVTTPHHQYPTTVALSSARRRQLLELCARERIAIVEDDYDHELVYEGKPILPLASADTSGTVIYVGTLSKIVAPGLRLGYVCAPTDVISRLAALRSHCDRQGDLVLEEAVAELFEDGAIMRHARRLKRAGHVRRDALVDALGRQFGERLSYTVPRGGMALWVHAPEIDVEGWCAAALDRGVAFATGRRYALDGKPRPFLRLGFAALDERELLEAVTRMAKALQARGRQRR